MTYKSLVLALIITLILVLTALNQAYAYLEVS